MFRLLLASAICLASAFAHAAPTEEIIGDSDCKIFNAYPAYANRVSWSGGCKDGFAHGTGKLDFDIKKLHGVRSQFSRYEGSVERGRLHGEGKLAYADGTTYQGGFSEGQYHGTGKLVTAHTTYEGGWKNGAQHGKGKIVYAYGGSYDGEWVDGRFHGKGVVIYAGGRRVEGDFVNGWRIGEAEHAQIPSGQRYTTDSATPVTGRWVWDSSYSTVVPSVLAYHEMTPGQKQAIRNQYPLLDESDEPPYPLHGKANIMRQIRNPETSKDVNGLLRLELMINEHGKATSVKFFPFGNAMVARIAAVALLNETYKPALCQGKPCAMVYPFAMEFETY